MASRVAPAACAATLLALLAIVCLGAVATRVWISFSIAAFAGLAVLLVITARRGRLLPGSRLLWPMAAFGLLLSWQAWRPASIYPYITRTGWVELSACGAIFYLAFYGFRRSASIRWAGGVLWAFTGLLAVEALLQYYLANGKIYWFRDASYGTPVGPYVYHNYYAGTLDLLLPMCLAAAFVIRHTDLSGQVRRLLPAALALISMIMSQSRGGLFTLAFDAALATLVWYPWLAAHPRTSRRAGWAALALLAAVGLASWGPMAHRLSLLTRNDTSTENRIEVAKACVRIWRDHPWLGTGFGTFATIYPRYQTFDDGLTWEQAHNEYAQLLAETGLVGMACVLTFAALLLWLGWSLRGYDPEPATVLAQAAWIGSMGLLFHSAGDFLFHAPGIAWLFFVLTGMVAARARTLARRRLRSSVVAAAGAV